MLVMFLLLFFWLSFWSSQAGRSFPIWTSWQDKKDWYSEVPEAVVGLTIGGVGTWGQYQIFENMSLWWCPMILLGMSALSYAGKQSATWAYLKWEGYSDGVTSDRQSTLRPLNDLIAAKLGYRFLSEGYSWIWASTKGFITTLPVMGLGLIFQPLGREIASHSKKIGLPFTGNFWMEFLGDGLAYSSSCTLFIILINFLVA